MENLRFFWKNGGGGFFGFGVKNWGFGGKSEGFLENGVLWGFGQEIGEK